MVVYVDDMVLLGPAGDVAQAITEIQTEATRVASSYKKPRRGSGPPSRNPLTMNHFSAPPFKEGWEISEEY